MRSVHHWESGEWRRCRRHRDRPRGAAAGWAREYRPGGGRPRGGCVAAHSRVAASAAYGSPLPGDTKLTPPTPRMGDFMGTRIGDAGYLALAVLLGASERGFAAACSGRGVPEALAAAQAQCCPARNHGAYVSCAAHVTNELVKQGKLQASCKSLIFKAGCPAATTTTTTAAPRTTTTSITPVSTTTSTSAPGASTTTTPASSTTSTTMAGGPTTTSSTTPAPTTTTTPRPTSTTTTTPPPADNTHRVHGAPRIDAQLSGRHDYHDDGCPPDDHDLDHAREHDHLDERAGRVDHHHPRVVDHLDHDGGRPDHHLEHDARPDHHDHARRDLDHHHDPPHGPRPPPPRHRRHHHRHPRPPPDPHPRPRPPPPH